jgi:hypothetical protein
MHIVINLCSLFNFKCYDFQYISLDFLILFVLLIYKFVQLFHNLLSYVRCMYSILFIAGIFSIVRSWNFILGIGYIPLYWYTLCGFSLLCQTPIKGLNPFMFLQNLNLSGMMGFTIEIYLIYTNIFLVSSCILIRIITPIYFNGNLSWDLHVIFLFFGPMCMSTVVSFLYVYISTTGNTKLLGLLFQWRYISDSMERRNVILHAIIWFCSSSYACNDVYRQ